MNRKIKEYIEFEIRHYHENKKELEDIRDEILYNSPGENETGIRSTDNGDPTGDNAVKLATNARIKRLEQTVKAIDSVLEEIDETKFKLINLRYWEKPKVLNDEGIAQELSIDRRTLYRWVEGITYAIAKEMGIVS